MRLGRLTNGVSCEYAMQDSLEEWLKEKGYRYRREFRVSDVGRIADFLVCVPSKGLVNIEAKCTGFRCMLDQLDDHAKYCDYCFAFIPDYAPTPRWFKEELSKKGYGLIVYNYSKKVVTEVFESHVNRLELKELRNITFKLVKG